jgi:hypothetical protein
MENHMEGSLIWLATFTTTLALSALLIGIDALTRRRGRSH